MPGGDLRETSQVIEEFYNAAKRYCRWAEADPSDEKMEALTARSLLAELYVRALGLPDAYDYADSMNEATEDEDAKARYEVWQQRFRRFGALPFNYYSVCAAPFVVPTDETSLADLADDLADIYGDLKDGINYYEAGSIPNAVWEWQFNFTSHWGEHLTSALNALQQWISDHQWRA